MRNCRRYRKGTVIAVKNAEQDRDQVEEMYLMLWYVNDEWSWNDQRENVFDTGLKYFAGNVGYVIEYED